MPMLDDAEIKEHRGWMSEWRTPDDMIKYAEGVMDWMGDSALFRQSGVGFVREAYAAGVFGRARGASDVRLVRKERPDFELRTADGGEEVWELTEADKEGRKRGDEYRQGAKKVGESVAEWRAAADQVPKILKDRARAKAENAEKNRYPDGTRLLIYLNINEYGVQQKEIEEGMQEATEPAKEAFAEVWVLWKGQVYRLWANNGQPVFEKYGHNG